MYRLDILCCRFLAFVFICNVILLCVTDARADYALSSVHPRVLITPSELITIIERMYGTKAREPYLSWFQRVQTREQSAQSDVSKTPNLMSLALLYKATNNSQYKTWYLNALETYLDSFVAMRQANAESQCGPSFACFTSMDIMWGDVPDSLKLKAFNASSGINAFFWHSGSNSPTRDFAYHSAIGTSQMFAFAALFDGDSILNHPDVIANPSVYSFDTSLFIKAMQEEFSATGTFWRTENRIAGDPTYNSALAGDFGGTYDNMAYDTAEESWSIFIASAYSTSLGVDKLTGFLHDQYRGRFYQNLGIPYTASVYGTGANQYKTHTMEIIWKTQTDGITGPAKNMLAITASKYKDPYMQYYADRWRKELNTYSYDYYTTEIPWMLCFYDDSIPIYLPSSNPTARYFSGPGIVSMRENWTDDASFAVFLAGEGLSRRYEDGNSFVLSRKGPVVVHAGARIRFNSDNNKHHWYHIRSISKNTLKIFDPDESFDVDSAGRITALHSGKKLIESDNVGGQLFETAVSSADKPYEGTLGARSSSAFELGIWNTADITKFEHVDANYTYTVGDATEAYSKKIDFFERELVYLRPNAFVMFDRVQTPDANFRRFWSIHTVDEPVSTLPTSATGYGMKTYSNVKKFTISNSKNVTTLHTIFPSENVAVARGGDTVLTTGNALKNGVNVDGAKITQSDMPRWLELFATGVDTQGSVTIYGDADEGVNTSETVAFTGKTQIYQNTTYGATLSGNRLTDNAQNWETNKWAGYMLKLHCAGCGLYAISANTGLIP